MSSYFQNHWIHLLLQSNKIQRTQKASNVILCILKLKTKDFLPLDSFWSIFKPAYCTKLAFYRERTQPNCLITFEVYYCLRKVFYIWRTICFVSQILLFYTSTGREWLPVLLSLDGLTTNISSEVSSVQFLAIVWVFQRNILLD